MDDQKKFPPIIGYSTPDNRTPQQILNDLADEFNSLDGEILTAEVLFRFQSLMDKMNDIKQKYRTLEHPYLKLYQL